MSSGGPQQPIGDNELCGVYYAKVTQNDNCDPGARVRVRFPWMPEGERDQSYWAQVAAPMIGESYGAYTLPEVDDTVFVVFLAGDIRFPVVIGGMWNTVDEPPETNANGKNDFRLIKSRSAHRVILDDSDKTKVVVTDRKDQNVMTVGEYSTGGSGENTFEARTPGGMLSQPEKGISIAAMSGGAQVNVWCPNGTLTVEAKDVEISASKDLEIKAGSTLKIEATTEIKAGSSGVSNYEGSPIKAGS